jgi:thioredoxin reductase
VPAYDVIVVGGGPAGLSAALMLGRCRRHVLVCDRGEPRNERSAALHGYLTRDGIAPSDFRAAARDELAPYAVEFRSVGVKGARPERGGFSVRLVDGRRERSRFLLLATGVKDQLPEVPGCRRVLRPLCLPLSVLRRMGMPRQAAGRVRPRTHSRWRSR